MFKKFKSHWIVFIILLQKLLDIFYQKTIGLPTLKRCQLSANIYLGGQYNWQGLNKLKEMGITAIVSMRENSIYKVAQREGFKYLHLPTIDNTPPSLDDLLRGVAFINAEIKEQGKVYIHCRQGLGRGPSMAIAYYISMGTTYEDALALVKHIRPFIRPTSSQIRRLKELESYFLYRQSPDHNPGCK